ncbi:MAG: type IV pilus secretin PilQ [Acidobacteria bacterium]|nr:type IV pilus secretin PilQ [Acidobacteriota bacterium]
MNDQRRTTVSRRGARWGGITALLALALCLVPLMAPAQQQDANRLPVGQLPTEADILQDPDLDGSPIDISFVDVDIRDVVRFFSQITGINLILDPEVSGPVTMELFQVPWDAALETVLASHGLGVIVQRNIVRITSLSKLAEEASERARLQDQNLAAQPLLTRQVKLSYASAEELLELTERQLSARGDAVVDIRTNSLIIRDTEESIASLANLLELLDQPAPQVNLKARIVETTRDFSRDLGVQWGFQGVADAAHGNTTGLVFPNNLAVRGQNRPSSGIEGTGIGGTPFAVNLPTSEATSGLALTMGSILDSFRLDVSLSAMESAGRGKVISTPNITAQNNQQAHIESGQRIPVQVLVDNTASIQFINANLQLTVTPQITDEDTIMLDIVVDKSEPDFTRQVNGVPTIFTRRAQTRVLVRNGGTTVIGGIFQLVVNEVESRVPVLHRIPLLGWLFKSQQTNQNNNELLIFITPQILEH